MRARGLRHARIVPLFLDISPRVHKLSRDCFPGGSTDWPTRVCRAASHRCVRRGEELSHPPPRNRPRRTVTPRPGAISSPSFPSSSHFRRRFSGHSRFCFPRTRRSVVISNIASNRIALRDTPTAINLAACLGKKEQRVLLLDLDPQGHASLGFGVYSDEARDLYDVFTGEVKLEDIIIPDVFAGVDVVPATMTLAAAEHLPVRSDERDRQLEIHLAGIKHRYDYAVIDCPPSMGLLSLNALMVADLVLIPIEMSLFGLNGIDHMYETIALLGERRGRKIPIRVVPTLVDSRTRLCRQFLHEVGERFADDVSSVMVQFTVRLKEAVRQGAPIIAYDPTSTAAVQYLRLADELMSNLQEQPKPESEHEHAARITGMKRAFEEARARIDKSDARH